MQRNNWREMNDVLIDNLKKANIKHSHSRKFKKVFFWTIGIIVAFVLMGVGILVYNLNKPFILSVATNIQDNNSFQLKVEKGSRISNLDVIELEGFEFVGWYKDADYTEKYLDNEVVDKSSQLYASYKVKQFQIDVPLNEAYEIEIYNQTNIVNYGEDFEFRLIANSDYDIKELQMMLNGKVFLPSFSDRYSATFKIANIKNEVNLEVAGDIAKFVTLKLYVDGNVETYEVRDTSNLQKFLASVDNPYTEYNTIGLFTDQELTKPANLTARLLNNITLHTKTSTSTNNINFKWNSSTTSWVVDISKSNLTQIVLPAKYSNGIYDGYITDIVGTAENSNNTITSVCLPVGTKNIDAYAFYKFTKLTNITIPNVVLTIGNSAFQYCSALESVTLSNGVTGIGNFAFENCTKLANIKIPNSIMVIGYYAFRYCTALTSIQFEVNSKLNNIGGMAFAYSGIKTISIPSSVTIIGYYNFYECRSLTKVILPNTISIISEYAFYNCVALNDIDIPTNVTTIGRAAFYNCDGLKEITIPSGITSISSSCFYDCDALTQITIPDNVTRIEDSAFRGCAELTKVTLSSKLTSISSYAFADCAKLGNFTIPSTVTSIGGSCFYRCKALTAVTIPSSVTTVSSSIFYECTNLKTVTFSAGLKLTSLGSSTFYGCINLGTVTFATDSKLSSLGSSTFYGCTKLQTITLPSTLTSISSSLFTNCTSLTKITIPAGVKTLGGSVFYGCTSLNNVTIPNTVTYIESYAFQNCTALTSINIPSSVTSTGYLPFFGCSSLTNLTLGKQSGYSWKAIRLDSQDIIVLSDNDTALQYLKGEKGTYKFQQEKN